MSTDLAIVAGNLEQQLSTLGNAGDRRLTRASTDIEAVAGWLGKYTHSKNTFDAYRREADRLLLWSADRGLMLSQLMSEDLVAYLAFLRDPQPLEKWCLVTVPRHLEDGAKNPAWRSVQRPGRLRADGTINSAWRPFVGALSTSAARQAGTVLFGLFEYLAHTRYLAGNPLRAAKTRASRPRQKSVERYLDEETWQHVQDWLGAVPHHTDRESAHLARIRFVLNFLYLTGLRRFELAQATTGDLRRKDGGIWLRVVGKGDVVADIPLSSAAMRLIDDYRASTGRGPVDPGKPEPLVMDIAGAGRAVSVKTIHAIVKAAFNDAASSCRDPFQRRALEAASAHWLRHSTATHLLSKGLGLLQTRDLLRHASAQTTEIYLHGNAEKLRADIERIQGESLKVE